MCYFSQILSWITIVLWYNYCEAFQQLSHKMKSQALFPKVSVWQFLSNDDCVQLGQDEVIKAFSKGEGMKRRRRWEQRKSEIQDRQVDACVYTDNVLPELSWYLMLHASSHSVTGYTLHKSHSHKESWGLPFVSSPFHRLFQTTYNKRIPEEYRNDFRRYF